MFSRQSAASGRFTGKEHLMPQASGYSGHRSRPTNVTDDGRQPTEKAMDQMKEAADAVSEKVRDLRGRATDLAGDLGTAVKEHPYATLAIAAGLAFAVGALWKLGHQRPQSRLEALLAQLPEVPSRNSLLPRGWR
jgi:ElaB/YqjD/DUF883 family membrane-anchored ribosome-binding protein